MHLDGNDTTPSTAATMFAVRDAYITLKAYLYAVAQIQSLPSDRQEWDDMCEMIGERAGSALALIVCCVERHVGHEIDLWPEGDDFTDADYAEKEEFRAAINEMKRVAEALSVLAAPATEVVRFVDPGEAA